MKKMFSILLALTLCLCSLTALAESEVPSPWLSKQLPSQA